MLILIIYLFAARSRVNLLLFGTSKSLHSYLHIFSLMNRTMYNMTVHIYTTILYILLLYRYYAIQINRSMKISFALLLVEGFGVKICFYLHLIVSWWDSVIEDDPIIYMIFYILIKSTYQILFISSLPY